MNKHKRHSPTQKVLSTHRSLHKLPPIIKDSNLKKTNISLYKKGKEIKQIDSQKTNTLLTKKRKKQRNSSLQLVDENRVLNPSKVCHKEQILGQVQKKFQVFSIRLGMDFPLFTLTIILLLIGLIMLFSASYVSSYYYYNSDSLFIIKRQVLFAILGFVIMLILSYFDYHHLHKFAWPLLLISYIFLIGVLSLPPVKEVHRWIDLGFFTFQPSEISKLAIILCFSHLISITYKKMETFRYGVLPYILILAPQLYLLFREPHISALMITIFIAGMLLFLGGIKIRWFVVVIGGLVAGVLYIIRSGNVLNYADNRILVWIDPFGKGVAKGLNNWQIKQSLYSVGSGGLFGLGLGQSRQKCLYLPEPQNDFIFAVVCEELGFIGALIIIILFVLLAWRGIIVALKAKDKFGMLIGMGIIFQIAVQVILNIAVVTNSIPNTGISLPFFSYGGTSLIILMAQMGILLSISRSSKIDDS